MDTATWYSIAKALHLIGMASWMAGMFYLVRIMVYHAMAAAKASPEREILASQFVTMEWKAYKIILRPAVVITWSFGVMMLFIQPVWLEQGWMQVKLAFLLLLTGYTHWLQSHIRQLEAGTSAHGHLYFRALNEVPTIALAGIVFLAVFRDRISFLSLFIGLGIFVGLIVWGIWRANSR
ncbi:MAG: CopD family protein [Saprospiraceae bacterium]|nr:CopD family protein [Saprospiraceae bacterium]